MVEEVERDCFARGAGRRGTDLVKLTERTQFRARGREWEPAGTGSEGARLGECDGTNPEVDETNPIPGPRLGADGGPVRGGTRADRGADFEGGAWKRPWYAAGSAAKTARPSPEHEPVSPCSLRGSASICSGECMDLPGGSAPTLIVARGVVISGWCFSVSC
jgi:hypothetical protein